VEYLFINKKMSILKSSFSSMAATKTKYNPLKAYS